MNYDEQTTKHWNPIVRLSHLTRSQMARDFVMDRFPKADVMDYGCGTGTQLQLLAEAGHSGRRFGYEPFQAHAGKGYEAISDASAARNIDLVLLLEVIEHLDAKDIAEFSDICKSSLKKGGRILVSCPIELGPILLVKEAKRMFDWKRKSEYRVGELAAAALLGRPGPRAPDIKASHRGFDFRQVPSLLKSFQLEEKWYSPMRKLPWFMNSQAFFVFVKL